MDKEVLETIWKKKMDESKIFKIVKIEGQNVMAKGENYTSVVQRYRVEIVLHSGEKCVKSLIIKTYPTSEAQVKFLQEFPLFKVEIGVYSKLLIFMESLMEEFEDRRDKLWCTMIGYKPYNMLILEDLKDKNFEGINRRDNLDYEHSLLVMRALGRYHAMSKILLIRNVISTNEFQPFMFCDKFISKLIFIGGLTALEETVRNSWGKGWTKFAELLNKVKNNASDLLVELVKVDSNRFNVINHGDSWTNNMLFKHVEGTKIPCSVKFVDYQLSHYNSFGWDLTYFLHNSTKPSIRRAKYIDLLTAYQQSLSYNLKFYKYNGNDVPTMDVILKEMDRLKFFGFLQLISVFALTSADVTDAFDVEKALQNIDKSEMAVNKDIYNSSKYRNEVEEDFANFVKQGGF